MTPSVLAQQQLDRVEITGSSIKRVDAETALPVTVIRVEDLQKQGVTTAEQALQRIAANQSNTGISGAIGSGTAGTSQADLRGLGAASGNQCEQDAGAAQRSPDRQPPVRRGCGGPELDSARRHFAHRGPA